MRKPLTIIRRASSEIQGQNEPSNRDNSLLISSISQVNPSKKQTLVNLRRFVDTVSSAALVSIGAMGMRVSPLSVFALGVREPLHYR